MNALSLLDWRRRVAALYSEVRSTTDPRAAHELWSRGRDVLLATHPESPIPIDQRPRFRGVPVAPYDPTFRFDVLVDTDVAETTRDVETGTDGVVKFRRIGVLELSGIGRLDVWWLDAYGGGLFVPIRDGLAGRSTYAGGRYLIDTVKGADLGGSQGRLIIDLNFAYNPSCAYDPGWVCPLAPPGNVVSVDLPVGELLPT